MREVTNSLFFYYTKNPDKKWWGIRITWELMKLFNEMNRSWNPQWNAQWVKCVPFTRYVARILQKKCLFRALRTSIVRKRQTCRSLCKQNEILEKFRRFISVNNSGKLAPIWIDNFAPSLQPLYSLDGLSVVLIANVKLYFITHLLFSLTELRFRRRDTKFVWLCIPYYFCYIKRCELQQ